MLLSLRLGCVIEQHQNRNAKVIRTVNNTESSNCSAMCNEDPKCNLWTQHYGNCFIKNEDSYGHFRKMEGHKWISGSKQCEQSGIYN